MLNKPVLDELYERYNKREYVHPDPLEFLYNYKDAKDREIVGLIASSLAYGRVAQILKSVAFVLDRISPTPSDFILSSDKKAVMAALPNFKHRFHTTHDITALILGIRKTLKEYGTLENCFCAGLKKGDNDVNNALAFFVDAVGGGDPSMLSSPRKGSACKRLNLYLRWMVRRDDVDPGGWKKVKPAHLVVPLDTHMHKIGLMLKATKRKQANLITAVEITEAFRQISPEDPVKYDFALTRFGIRSEMNINDLKLVNREP